ncbi:MAG: NADH-quinone oxidoreductase subunit NuoH [Thermodesulfobacteriota bacterium]
MAILLEIFIIIVKVMIIAGALFSLPMPLTWIERKVAGHIQVRLGPFRVGPHGILQPLADTIKMLLKEDVVPSGADKILFKLAPLISLVPMFLIFVAVPFGESVTLPYVDKEITLYLSDMNMGILYVLAVSGLSVYGLIFGGWASNSKYALLGGLRSSAQMISYEVALTFAVIGVVMISGSLSLLDIVKSQYGGVFHWNVFYLPVGPVWFVIFLIAGLAEMNRIPFDLPEDEGTLAAGFHTEYSGMRFSFFALAEYVAMTSIAVLTTVLFLGGWDDPFGMGIFPGIFWFMGKTAFLIYFFMWVRFTIPRYRYDQLMNIGWKILIPIAMLNVLATGFLKIWVS